MRKPADPHNITRNYIIQGERWTGVQAVQVIKALCRRAAVEDECFAIRYEDTDNATGKTVETGLCCYDYGLWTRNIID